MAMLRSIEETVKVTRILIDEIVEVPDGMDSEGNPTVKAITNRIDEPYENVRMRAIDFMASKYNRAPHRFKIIRVHADANRIYRVKVVSKS